MSPHETDQVKLYLLGQLDEASLAQFEKTLLTSETFYDEVLMAEDELADQYLANELSEKDRESFERHFLSVPERRQKLRFARTLRRYVGEAAESSLQHNTPLVVEPDEAPVKPISKKGGLLSFLRIQNQIAAYALAAAVLITVGGISWVAFNYLQPPLRTSGKVFLVNLSPGLTRDSGEVKTFAIPADTDSVQLNLDLPSDEYPAYRAELLTTEQSSLLVKEDLKSEDGAGNKTINFTIPADILKRNDYRVKLNGRTADGSYESLSSYTFRVTENR